MFDVPVLDRDLGSQKGPVLLRHELGVRATPFLVSAAARHLQRGGQVAWLATDRPPTRFRDEVAEAGADVEHLLLLDGHGPRHHWPDPEATPVPLDDGARMLRTLDEVPGDALLLVEDLATVLEHLDAKTASELLDRLAAHPLAIAAHLDLEERSALPFDRFQQQVRLSSIQERLLIHDYFQVERRDGRPLTPRRRLYKSNAGAVRVYIPKILVSGPHDAGKTTFVHAAAQRASSAEVRGTTVALDRGTVDIDGATVELYGTPGQSRFDPLLDTLAHQAVALVLVVDATRPEDDARAQDMAAALSHRGLTVVIAANKQDQPGARDPDAVAAAVAQGTYPAVGCIASDPESARHVLADLLDRLLHGRPDEDVPEVVAG